MEPQLYLILSFSYSDSARVLFTTINLRDGCDTVKSSIVTVYIYIAKWFGWGYGKQFKGIIDEMGN
jgi:hypothetical protein